MPLGSRKVSVAASITLGTAAFVFKLAFTRADAPELLAGLEGLTVRIAEGASLVTQARIVFVGIVMTSLIICVPKLYQKSLGGRRSAGMLTRREKISGIL